MAKRDRLKLKTMKNVLSFVLLAVAVSLGRADNFKQWFADELKEVLDDPVELMIEGSLPSYLKGNLMRLGPSQMHTDKRNYTNCLDGFGRVSKWILDGSDQKVSFQSQMIKSNVYNSSLEENDITAHVTQQTPDPGFSLGIPDLKNMDNTDVNLFKFEGEESFLAFTDYATSNVIDERTLRTLGNIENNDDDCSGECKGASFSGSHPGVIKDKKTGKETLVNWIGTKGLYDFEIAIYTMDSSLKRRVIGSIKQNWMPFSVHAVAVTENYVALVMGAVTMDFAEVGINFCLACSSNDKLHDKDTRVYVFKLYEDEGEAPLSKKTPPVVNYNIPKEDGMFVFHYVNAFVENGKGTDGGDLLSVDVCAYDTVDPFLFGDSKALGDYHSFLTPSIRDTMPYNCDALRRLDIDINANKLVSRKDLPLRDDQGVEYRGELISINPNYWGRADACFAYGVTYHANGSERYEDMGIFKADLCAANRGDFSTVRLIHEEDMYTGEPLFIADPNGVDEDDGCLLVVIMDGKQKTSALKVYDAKSLEVLATIQAPFLLPFEFHGQWIA